MQILKFKGYEGTAEVDMDRGVCRGKILFITDLVTYQAATPADLRKEFEAAVDDYLATCAELGRDPIKPLCGTFNVRIEPELHKQAKLRGLADGVSLNEVVARAIDCYVNHRAEVTNNYMLLRDETAIRTVTAYADAPDVAGERINVH